MLFSELRSKKFGEINLNTEAQRWLEVHASVEGANPLLDPDTCLQMVHEASARLGFDFSYGGWLEDRSDLWRGSYLDESGMYVHLGIDFNVPIGTSVAADGASIVLRVDSDFPAEGGWGNRVIMRLVDRPIVVIYAHLSDEILCRVGDRLSPGQVFAHVGTSSQNGGWFPHLHVQCVDATYFDGLSVRDFELLDGYGKASELEELLKYCVDPFTVISLHE